MTSGSQINGDPGGDTTTAGNAIRRYAWAAALLSLLAPGLGQVYTSRLNWLGYFAAAWAAVIVLFHTDLPSSFVGFVALLSCLAFVQLTSIVQAALAAWRNPTVQRASYHRWYVYAAYAVAFTTIVTVVNAGALTAFGEPSIFGAYKPYRASSSAMAPTLRPGEFFVVKLANGASQAELADDVGKIVVVGWPDEPSLFVYRLTAVGGQTIATQGRDIVINGKKLARKELCSFAPELGDSDLTRAVETNGGRSYVVEHIGESRNGDGSNLAVPDDYLFVLGDSRDNARDSRFRSATAAKNLAGRALFILWSDDLSRIGRSLLGDEPVARQEYCTAEK